MTDKELTRQLAMRAYYIGMLTDDEFGQIIRLVESAIPTETSGPSKVHVVAFGGTPKHAFWVLNDAEVFKKTQDELNKSILLPKCSITTVEIISRFNKGD